MSKRFGRNQRRTLLKLKERVEAYQALHIEQAQEIQKLRFRLDDLTNDAFQRYAKQHGMLERYIDRIGAELGKALGKELLPHALKIFDAAPQRPFIKMRADHASDQMVEVLYGTIPQLNYRIAVFP